MSAQKKLKWLPNIISASRIVLAIFMFLAAISEHWGLAFWLLLTAMATDYLDGWLAKKLTATSEIGEDLDRYSDAVLAILGALSLVVIGIIDWRWFLLLIPYGLYFEGNHKKWKTDDWLRKALVMLPVTILFSIWILVAWAYAILAFGWSWYFIPITLGIIAPLGVLKKHRIKAWINPTN